MHSHIARKIIQFTHNYKDVCKGKNKTQNNYFFIFALIASIYAFETSLKIYFSNINFGTFKKSL